ncbi:MarR family winged helix-turn-helix transcriptional regulator [Streptomyces ipomoeae]|uniref:MarR family winged helix-turn-helix transcriptional regulator n=1 Tax=Streptomyces ipomoeae TaxID=103232 RepID=UPI001146AEDB|nr:MarR family winged helix-turn-helix transcriptional regulator [Streptomyces ipomoeae]MDX2826928.1 MarR family winged helix-turn-helix transcriptional regulator [Streptomyces ipomoeae]MDX2879564.1 MarR family winged helix-turn-helix transcriptional regulator [Streptomyces ipomoeae]MDX2939742.1 MarR family winged helix-turn-helix transcriptional regulator [Streptomyces ipomoeae]TQE25285.1 MarR family transcriptional regulator [Streptomyces ipomoeae]TQE33487.1 MarR family transcriptional regul
MPSTPPTLTALTTYLLSQVGKNARGLLIERLTARNLRLWHMSSLAALADFGPHVQRDLAGRLAIHTSDMTKVLDELADWGYITRDRDGSDRRRILATITQAGREALADLNTEAEAAQNTLLTPLTPDERTQLHNLLLRLHTAR